MNESELFDVIEGVHTIYAALLGMVITINFAMIVAVWTFLHRAALAMRVAAFAFYLVGMGLLTAMLVQQAHIRDHALSSLRNVPNVDHSHFIALFLSTQDDVWFRVVWLAQHMAPALLVLGVAYLLFAWKGRPVE